MFSNDLAEQCIKYGKNYDDDELHKDGSGYYPVCKNCLAEGIETDELYCSLCGENKEKRSFIFKEETIAETEWTEDTPEDKALFPICLDCHDKFFSPSRQLARETFNVTKVIIFFALIVPFATYAAINVGEATGHWLFPFDSIIVFFGIIALGGKLLKIKTP